MHVLGISLARIRGVFRRDCKQKPPINNGASVKELPCDTLSLSQKTITNTPEDRIYRAIGQSEFEALLRGDTIFSSGYVTNNPKGWMGADWNTGFHCESKDSYFVTFKNENLPFVGSRDFWNDPRLGVNGYTIDNVESIRKGFNIHGELVFARNFKDAQMRDRKIKFEDIRANLRILARNNDDAARREAWDNLTSYVKEFPKIVKDSSPFVRLKNAEDLNNYAILICESDRKENMPLLRNVIKYFIKADVFPPHVVSLYLGKHGQSEDISLLLDLLNKFSQHEKMEYQALNLGKTISLLSDGEAKTHKLVYRSLLSENPTKLNILTTYFSYFNKDGAKTPVLRKILNKCQKISRICVDDLNYNMAVTRCAQELSMFGDMDDIRLLEHFIDKANPQLCPSDAVYKAINSILKRFKAI